MNRLNEKKELLYELEDIRIYSHPDFPREHSIYADLKNGEQVYCYLGKGSLERLTEIDKSGFRKLLFNIKGYFVYKLLQNEISIEEIGWIFVRARNVELENKLSDVCEDRPSR